ncbi:MAG: ribosome biogenesis/translation initiation ATPase RLI, partial [Candidatus Aenigmatarchaeota archaeon]
MVQKRVAIIDRELCRPELTGYACMKACPVNRAGKDCIVTAEDKKVLINEGLCIGCGICIKKCTQDAIKVVNLPEKLDEEPIHRYGKNLFILFRLPIPKANTIVGLVGQNGMGKTTLLNILSGTLRPNTGLLEEEASWDAVIDRFRGTELQGYLEALARNGIKAAYKPQHVDEIPKLWKGSVRARLEKLGSLEDVAKKLGLEAMLDKDIAGLSGGELQLLAVAATILKPADFYFFDEPSSYLDVKERLLVAKEIRALARKARVMVVEHDLAVADYLADTTHILYGHPGVFGIVSNPYGVRVGINTYLDGYIREENVRFRTEPIVFEKRAKLSEKRGLFLEFPGLKKAFKGFSLETS